MCSHPSCPWVLGSDEHNLRTHIPEAHGETMNLPCCGKVMGKNNDGDIRRHEEDCASSAGHAEQSQASRSAPATNSPSTAATPLAEAEDHHGSESSSEARSVDDGGPQGLIHIKISIECGGAHRRKNASA
ncbi:hypothetical protein CGCSCA4_v002798 [Colletotrichum siamense]|uniref:Uncharacterized protein n=1 Tax=Colletotrichum siamense TaxID=690259 RepID=A0A9P5KBR0_COLSI|nr:hypothetical protein CGCSCA4_v002798 [Colletotrichum siamense]KAF4866772.1 hypothetical protein CGCSCA2_v000584 [Colletotrichum siamense]